MFSLKSLTRFFLKMKNRDLKIVGYVEVIEGDLFVKDESIQISIICPRPYWESAQAISDELSYIVRKFEFPFSIENDGPIPISEYTTNPFVITVINRGDVECGAIFTVTFSGGCSNFVLYNQTTQKHFGVTKLFTNGDTLTMTPARDISRYIAHMPRTEQTS